MRLAGTLFLVLAAAAQVRTLQDGTPVRLRLNRTVSSANAHVGETVDFELSIDSVRLPDGRTIPLRATREKGDGDMSGARVAATIAASPVLVWVKGKDVVFEKGTETTAYVSGDARIEESQPRTSLAPDSAADRSAAPSAVLTNADIVQMQKAGLSEEIVLSKIGTSPTNFATDTQDLIQLKEAGVNDNIIHAMVQKAGRQRP
jgi:hypothetical protein